jgi:hypothetical protein
MATIITITQQDTDKSIQQKLQELKQKVEAKKGFPAADFTGKVTSFGHGLEYQKVLRNEWK